MCTLALALAPELGIDRDLPGATSSKISGKLIVLHLYNATVPSFHAICRSESITSIGRYIARHRHKRMSAHLRCQLRYFIFLGVSQTYVHGHWKVSRYSRVWTVKRCPRKCFPHLLGCGAAVQFAKVQVAAPKA